MIALAAIAFQVSGELAAANRRPASHIGKRNVRAAMRSGHCQLAGATSRATRPGIGPPMPGCPTAAPPSPNHSCRFFWSARDHADLVDVLP